ncbi:MAG: 3-dehydroquinate synthase [Thermostichales cyanobacterium SRBZ-1_bins_19]
MLSAVIPVRLPQAQYDIVIEPDSLAQIGEPLRERGLKGKALIVSHPVIFKHYGAILSQSLQQAGFTVDVCLVPAGERYKTLKSVQKIYDAALAAGLERQSTILALGGGVIGDMAGFAAATWLRGIPFVQVPTTLLAMVDAAIGGKTGVNHPQGKNLIGAFHQPRLVWIDPTVLQTLPGREFRSALAEVVKYGVIQDPDLFQYLEQLPRLEHYGDWRGADLFHVLVRCAECKAWVVQQDEREAGLRAILNYGHTLAHALESLTNYRHYLHGEAVAVGMVGAGALAVALGWWTAAEQQRQVNLLARCGLPTKIPAEMDLPAVIRLLHHDKKVQNGHVRFILPKAIGQVAITDEVTDALALQVWSQWQGDPEPAPALH